MWNYNVNIIKKIYFIINLERRIILQQLNINEDKSIFKECTQENTTKYHVIKRGIDIICSSIGLIVLSPILVIIAIIIKLDSSGPIIFKQERVGYKGRRFFMYKFRSMVVNAEELKDKLHEKIGRASCRERV